MYYLLDNWFRTRGNNRNLWKGGWAQLFQNPTINNTHLKQLFLIAQLGRGWGYAPKASPWMHPCSEGTYFKTCNITIHLRNSEMLFFIPFLFFFINIFEFSVECMYVLLLLSDMLNNGKRKVKSKYSLFTWHWTYQ